MAVNTHELLGCMSEEQYAEFRGVQIQALRNERARGKGPPYIKAGRIVKYPIQGVADYHAAHTVTPGKTAPTLIDSGSSRRRQRAAA